MPDQQGNEVDGVLFDLFETLVSESLNEPDYVEWVASRLGISQADWRTGWQGLRRLRMTTPMSHEDVLLEICRVAGLGPTADRMTAIAELAEERAARKARPLLDVEPCVVTALRRLRDAGIRVGVVSNCSMEEVRAWTASPLAEVVDDAVFSFEVGALKPEPAIYAQACRRLRVAPERTVFVGDGGSDELAGAEAAGLIAYAARWFVERRSPACQGELSPVVHSKSASAGRDSGSSHHV